jgi:hypothetical protein
MILILIQKNNQHEDTSIAYTRQYFHNIKAHGIRNRKQQRQHKHRQRYLVTKHNLSIDRVRQVAIRTKVRHSINKILQHSSIAK